MPWAIKVPECIPASDTKLVAHFCWAVSQELRYPGRTVPPAGADTPITLAWRWGVREVKRIRSLKG